MKPKFSYTWGNKLISLGTISTSLGIGAMLCNYFKLLPDWLSFIITFLTGLIVLVIYLAIEEYVKHLTQSEFDQPKEVTFVLKDNQNEAEMEFTVNQLVYLVKQLKPDQLGNFSTKLKENGLI